MAKQIKLVKSLSGRKKDQVATANSLVVQWRQMLPMN